MSASLVAGQISGGRGPSGIAPVHSALVVEIYTMVGMKPLPDTLGLEEILRDTVVEVAKAYGKAATKQALGEVSEFVRDLASDTVGVFMGAVCKCLLQVLLNRETTIASKLDTLIREPALTGISVGSEVFTGTGSDEDALRFRQERLNFAVQRLDVARTLSSRSKDMQYVLVTLLQAFFLTQVRGGSVLARTRFKEVRPALSDRAAVLSDKAKYLCERARDAHEAANREQEKEDHYGERAVDVFIHPATYGLQAGILKAAAALNDQECEQARAALQSLRQIIEIIDAYCKCA